MCGVASPLVNVAVADSVAEFSCVSWSVSVTVLVWVETVVDNGRPLMDNCSICFSMLPEDELPVKTNLQFPYSYRGQWSMNVSISISN